MPPNCGNNGVLNLWAIGVGAVISGDFFGWNFVLSGGYGGALICFVPALVFYTLLCFSVAELSTRLPNIGGAYSFVQTGCGPLAGALVGVAETVKLVSTSAAIAAAVSSYLLGAGAGAGPAAAAAAAGAAPLGAHAMIWLIFLGVILAVNIAGVKSSFGFQLFLTSASVAILLAFYIGALTCMDFQKNAVGDGWFPSSSSDILKGMPFILWLFLGIEEVPLAVEEVANPVKTIPRGIAGGLGTLGALAALTVTLTCALPPGAGAYARDPAPLLTGFRAILGPSKFVDAIGCAVVVGLVCSLHTLVYFSGQTVAALARGGVYPAALGRPGPRGTPARALGLVAFSALALLFMLFGIFGEDACTSIPVALSLMVSMFSYVMQLISYIKISHVPPNDALLCSKDGCKKLLGNYSSTARAPAFSVPTTVLGQDDNVGIGLPSSLTMRSSPSPGVQYYQSPFGISGAICGIVLGILIWSCLVVLGFSDWSYASAFIASAFLFLVTFLCFSFFNSNGCFFNAKNKVSFAQPYCQNAPCMLGNTGQTRRASGPVAAKLHEIDASALDNNSYKRSIDDGEILSSCAIEPVPSIAQPNEQDQSCASMSTTLAMV